MKKFINKKLVNAGIIAGLLSASLSFTAFASPQQNSMNTDDDITVDVNTSDEVLLRGKDVAEMNKVLEPSVRLTMTIEGIRNKISVDSENGDVSLMVDDVSKEQVTTIKNTFKQITDVTNVKVVNSDMTENSDA